MSNEKSNYKVCFACSTSVLRWTLRSLMEASWGSENYSSVNKPTIFLLVSLEDATFSPKANV